MSLDLAENVAATSSVGCARLEAEASDTITLSDEAPSNGLGFQVQDGSGSSRPRAPRAMLTVGGDLSLAEGEQPRAGELFAAANLGVASPIAPASTNRWLVELSFGTPAGSPARDFGLNFDLGRPIVRTEIELAGVSPASGLNAGEQPVFHDQRHTRAKAPSWYVFVGADNQALLWNVADKQSLNGVALRDQLTIGDLQVGLAWSTAFGGHTAFGVVERKLKFNDMTGDHDVSERERFAAVSYSVQM